MSLTLQQDQRNRSWASHLLAALFRPSMPEKAPPELPLLTFHTGRWPGRRAPVTHWYLWMEDDRPDNRYLRCLLSRIDYCQCTDGTKHEFLLLYFTHCISSAAEAAVCVDRTMELVTSDSRQSSEIISPSPSLKETVATDHAFLLGSPDDAVRHLRSRYGRYKKLCTLTFSLPSAPSALQVAAILHLVHRQSPAYHLSERQCYWYADSVWMSLKKIFAQNQESCKDHNARGHYRGVILGPSPATVEAVCAAFLPEWEKTMNRVAHTGYWSEAELAQCRREGYAEGLAQAQQRRRVQLEAENEQLRARIAALEGQAAAI